LTRTQASLAVQYGEGLVLIVNATPDLRSQIVSTPALRPQRGPRHSPIGAVLLTGAEIDQIAGLLHLRESQPFALYATSGIFAAIDANPIFGVLTPPIVRRHVLATGTGLRLGELEINLFEVPGKTPIYFGKEAQADLSIGVEIRSSGKTLVYVPAARMVTADLLHRLVTADVVLFDGTLFSDDEMIQAGAGVKTGLGMGHMPISGETGSLKALNKVKTRRVFTHINNTNPILIEGSPQHRTVHDRG
jgi:pyrroloquinoline quinone biosynthesis protein B